MGKRARTSIILLVVGISMLAVAIVVAVRIVFRKPEPRIEDILAVYEDEAEYNGLTIYYPPSEAFFPPEIVAPTFRWEDGKSGSDRWLVTIQFQDDKGRMSFLCRDQQWTPKATDWEVMKKRSLEREAKIAILGLRCSSPARIVSGGRISIKTSRDEVGAPLFYREVNLPFVDAVKDPSHIRWRFGAVSSERPAVVLENMPVCGNCHSFSQDGKILAMDVDYANSKGSYVITRVAKQITLATTDIITWDDYRKEDGDLTFGLLSQVSPDGRFVVSTVKDRSVFVPKPGLEFSQLFFPIKGILCVYDRRTRTFRSLPGADDPEYVQSNPTWSPDGKYIVFARAKAYKLKQDKDRGKVLLTREECKEFLEDGKPFSFDLYRIPFHDGTGGMPEPLEGASNNGMSNFFAKYSPDGKWIVFCKAKNYMLLQPDSELYIIPAGGGEARKLRCNTDRMNSWHSWSPNSKWLVFSSKAYSAYTQLFLTHIDEEGRSSPPVLLAHFTDPDRAANIPEFVNTNPSAIKKIGEKFLDDFSYVRAGNEFNKASEPDRAIQKYRKALELNPNNVEAHQRLGFLLYHVKNMRNEGLAHSREALRLDPEDVRAHCDLGMALFNEGEFDQAIAHLSEALRLMPHQSDLESVYNPADTHSILGLALLSTRQLKEATDHLSNALRLDPNNDRAQLGLTLALRLARAAGEESLAQEIERLSGLYKGYAAPQSP
jgi:tetratricopeptide (TPR) repeat protein